MHTSRECLAPNIDHVRLETMTTIIITSTFTVLSCRFVHTSSLHSGSILVRLTTAISLWNAQRMYVVWPILGTPVRSEVKCWTGAFHKLSSSFLRYWSLGMLSMSNRVGSVESEVEERTKHTCSERQKSVDGGGGQGEGLA